MATIFTTALMGLFVLSNVSASAALAEAPVPERTFSVAMTAYNAVPEQTDDDPFTTASGAYSNPEVVAARSRDLAEDLPFGTVIEIVAATSTHGCGLHVVLNEVGLRVIADTMHQRMQQKIDILLHERKTARVFGICDKVEIRVVGQIDIKDMPKTQAELKAKFAKVEKATPQPLAIKTFSF